MSNPYRDVYEAIMAVMRTDPGITARASFVPMNEVDALGTARRKLDDGAALKLAIVPLGGKLNSISSSTSRAVEQYAVRSVAGNLPMDAVIDLKWVLIKAFWNARDLNLSYVESVDVLSVADESAIGTGSVDGGEGPSVTWQVSLVIEVSFLLNRTTLPMS